MLLSFVVSPLMLFSGFFLARFAGKGAMDLSASTLAPQWFIKRRAFSIMLVGLGGTVGGAVFPLLLNYLIGTYGWRQAYQILAGSLWLIYIPLTAAFLISRPEEVGLMPDARVAPKTNTSTGQGEIQKDETQQGGIKQNEIKQNEVDEVSFTQKEALRTSAFWILTFCVFQASLVGTGVILHFVSIFKELGYTMGFAAQIMSIKPLIGFVTIVIAGLSLDKIKQQNVVLAVACLAQVVSYIMLAFLNSMMMAYLYTLVSGVSSAVLFLSLGVLKPNLFGRRYLGGILGVVVAINVIGSAIGPVIFGAAFDAIGGYREIILLSALLPLAAGIMSFFLRKPQLRELGSGAS